MPDDLILDNKTRSEFPENFNKPQSKAKKIFIIFLVSVFVAAIFIGAWFLFARNKPQADPVSNNVVLQIKGPDQTVSGNEAEYRIIYRNGENADLIGVLLEVFYPAGFKFKSAVPPPTSSSGNAFNLPIVKQGQSAEVVIRGKLSGSVGEVKQIRANLHYKLSNFNSNFQVSQSLHTGILPPNLTMDINGPVDVVNGQDTTFNVTFTNVSGQDFENLAVTMTYPEGFKFTTSNLPASKNNNYWKFDKLASSSSTSIEISGSFMGDLAQDQLVKAELGQIINNVLAPQLTSTATFKIIPSSLGITLTSDRKDSVNVGDHINYKLKYINQGRIGLNNLIIIVNLEGSALDLTRLSANDAIITGSTLTWKSATLSKLNVVSPNESGEISFSVPVRQTLSSNLKNQIIKASAQISSDEVTKPTKVSDLVLKLASKLELTVQGEYVSGAVPMEVGKTTVFNMTFMISNLSNDLADTQVVASLPLPASAWSNIVIPDAEKSRLTYDENSGKIIWRIQDLPAFTGKYTPVLQATFQLQVTPAETDRNKSVDLLKQVTASATDTFTNLIVQTQPINSVSTSTIDDDVLDSKGTTVK